LLGLISRINKGERRCIIKTRIAHEGIKQTDTVSPLRIGIIGAGSIGQLAHLANFTAIDGVDIVGLADLRPELGRLVANKFKIPSLYPDHHTLLQKEKPDAVVVVTQRDATGPIVLDALTAGCDVLCEKPMCHTVEQGQRLVEAAKSAQKLLSVGFMKRHDAGTANFMEHLRRSRETGQMGDILLLRVWCYGGEFWGNAGNHIVTDESRPPGLDTWPCAPDFIPAEMHGDYARFLNVFVHDLNIMRYVAGMTPKIQNVDFRRKNGRLVNFDFGDFPGILEMAEVPFRSWQEGIEIVFEKGRMTLEFPSPLLPDTPARVCVENNEAPVPAMHDPAPSWSFQRQAAAFIEDVRNRHRPLTSGVDSLEDLKLAEAIWEKA